MIAWQMPLSWAYIFTITLAICTAGYLLKRGRLSTTLEGTKRWRPTWSLGQDSPQHHAITKNTVALSSIYLMPPCPPLHFLSPHSVHTLVFFNLLYLSLDSCTVISFCSRPTSNLDLSVPPGFCYFFLSFSQALTFLSLTPLIHLSLYLLYGNSGVKGLHNADSHWMKGVRKGG